MKAAVASTLTLVSLIACTARDPEKTILQVAKRDAAAYCAKVSREGCEFSIVKTPTGWGVMARPITRSDDGERVYVPGLWRSYDYDESGKLEREMPGL